MRDLDGGRDESSPGRPAAKIRHLRATGHNRRPARLASGQKGGVSLCKRSGGFGRTGLSTTRLAGRNETKPPAHRLYPGQRATFAVPGQESATLLLLAALLNLRAAEELGELISICLTGATNEPTGAQARAKV